MPIENKFSYFIGHSILFVTKRDDAAWQAPSKTQPQTKMRASKHEQPFAMGIAPIDAGPDAY